MPFRFEEDRGGLVIVIHVSGKLVAEDYERFVPEFERLVREHGKLRVLFDMKDVHGWNAGAVWQDTKFALHHFREIERLAMVGETRWQQGRTSFCKPFIKAELRYFDQPHVAEARAWLDAA